jgi:hypothetical protein
MNCSTLQRKPRRIGLLLCLVAVPGPLWLQTPTGPQVTTLDHSTRVAMARVSSDSLVQCMRVLGDDSLEGRGTGSPGGRKAADYVVQHLESIGLEPMGDGDSYPQCILLHGSTPLSSSGFQVVAGGAAHRLDLWTDYLLYNSGAQSFIPTPIPLVFAGYGIVAPEYDYDDYGGLSVENRIVVFLSGEPPPDDPAYFAGDRPTVYWNPTMKQRIALSRGAIGSIMIPLPREGTYLDWGYWQAQFSFEDVRLPYGISDSFNVLLKSSTAPLLFQGARFRFGEVLAFEEKGLLGSRYYCDHPRVLQTVAAINVDGVSLFDTYNHVSGVGGDLSTLGDRLEAVPYELDLGVAPIPPVFREQDPFSTSDQFSFAQAGIPPLLLMESLDYRHTSLEEGRKRLIEWGGTVTAQPTYVRCLGPGSLTRSSSSWMGAGRWVSPCSVQKMH